MAGFSLSSSPFSPFHLNRNAKLRLSQFVNQQSVAYLAYDKDKSYRYIHRAPKLRGWLRTPQTMLGSEDKSQIRGPQTAVLEPRNHDFNPKGFFPFGISSFHLSANDGKPGLVTFCNRPSNTDNEVTSSNLERIRKRISWFLGPAVLVLAFVYPPLFLPQVILRVFGDSPLTVFLLIFFTEVIFYCGVAVFLLLLNRLMRLKQLGTSANNIDILTLSMDKQITSVTTLVLRQLSIAIPMISMGLAWPWTGFVVPATLSPYLVGIFVQFIFELFARCWKSPSWAAIPFIFQFFENAFNQYFAITAFKQYFAITFSCPVLATCDLRLVFLKFPHDIPTFYSPAMQ
ncbi:hypothetical protein VNO78_23924 [Psophocarpus tetragonolobus]|uniref:Uncharacterized protein n=1 Tax=Psophocarpus tetragonolobus TaxID=3891 RepID=A0AAN9S527_PSOTE